MLFVTPQFALFFVLVVALYFMLPYRWRWALLLGASYYFYASWNANYLFLIVFSTAVDYLVGLALGRVRDTGQRRALLTTSVVVNLGVLFTFKYYNFFAGSLMALLTSWGVRVDLPVLQAILPVGISFYTFQSMSYTIDVFRGKITPERHFGIFATFIAFFPQLVAGPIERAGNMLPQFHQRFDFDYERTVAGFRLILWGAFKKVAIADRIAIYVNAVFGNPTAYSGGVNFLASLLFAIQIYCDFSAYSDIAIGVAKVMGFDLMENFQQPFFSRSVSEFWRRWHISLSTWFRDYLYFPLGGSQGGLLRTSFNLFVVFTISGVWHGVGWNYAIWGALTGIFIVIERIFAIYNWRVLPQSLPENLRAGLQMLWTFLFFSITLVIFRADSLETAAAIYGQYADFSLANIAQPFAQMPLGAEVTLILTLALIGLLFVVDALDAYYRRTQRSSTAIAMKRYPVVLRWASYYGLVVLIFISFIQTLGAVNDFIYFQF